jgi:hypothetical protein
MKMEGPQPETGKSGLGPSSLRVTAVWTDRSGPKPIVDERPAEVGRTKIDLKAGDDHSGGTAAYHGVETPRRNLGPDAPVDDAALITTFVGRIEVRRIEIAISLLSEPRRIRAIACGDGRDAGFLQRVIGDGAAADAAFLDPPYNVRIGGHAVAAGSHRELAMASGEMGEAEFRTFLADTLGAAARLSREGAVHFVCMDWRHMDSVSAIGSTVYGERLNLCNWNKVQCRHGVTLPVQA